MSEFTPRTMEDMQREWPEALDHVSASSLAMLARCPEQWRQRYVLKRKAPPAAAMVWGNADHRAIGWGYAEKLRSGNDAPTGDVMQMFATALDERIDEVGGTGEVLWEGLTRDGILKQGTQLVGLYRETVAPFVMPEAIEEEFTLTEGMPMPVLGYIDLVGSDHDRIADVVVPNTERIIERKTVSRSERGPKSDWQFQRRVYQIAKPIPLEWQLSVRTKTPKIQLDEPDVPLLFAPDHLATTRRSVEQACGYIIHLYTSYGPEQPWPAIAGLNHPWACGYCGYRPDCPYWNE